MSRSLSLSKAHRKKYNQRKEKYTIESKYGKWLLENATLDFNEQEKGLALISAFVLTDGWISKNKRKQLLELGFSNTNRELVQAFTDLVFITFGEVPSCINLKLKQKSSKYVAPWHQSIIRKISDFCFENTRKTAKNIFRIQDRNILNESVRIAFSCDGFISFQIASETYGFATRYYSRIRPNLSLGCKPYKLRIEWKKILEFVSLKPKLEKDRLKISSWKDLKKFNEIEGFLPDTLIGNDSKYFAGVDKNSIVKKLLHLKANNLVNNKCDVKDNRYLRSRIVESVEYDGITK